MRRITDWGPALVVLMATVLALLFAPRLIHRVEYAQTSARIMVARQALQDDDILERLDQAVRRIAESVEPSVVHIDVRISGGRQFGSSSGSAWVYDDQGHVVTNAHVIRGASRIRAQLSDGRLFDAEIIGADAFTDIAVVKIPTTDGLFPASRSTGPHPRQGERVFAFGSPFGFKFSMAEGIISGLGREPAGAVASATGYTNFIQTDAAVNPGNSGGPLVNVRGEVIGMNVAIATGADSQGTTEGQSAGISFAIPLPVIESVVSQLIATGSVQRGFLGIGLPQRSDQARQVGYNGFGVLIDSVSDGGPADRAGLKTNDVILRIDGQEVTGVGVLRSLISSVPPGDAVALRVWREGEEFDTTAVLDAAGSDVVVGVGIREELRRFGMLLNDRTRRSGDDPPVVTQIAPESDAERAGFVAGQRIVRVDGERIDTLEELAVQLDRSGLLIRLPIEVTVMDRDPDSGELVERVLRLQLSR